MSWKIQPSFTLPKGFELWEDEYFLELAYKEETVGVFTCHVDPSKILKTCKEYIKERGLDNA